MPTVGARIKALRKLRRLTQTDLAKALGIDQSTVSDIERGAGFQAEVLYRLTEALQTSARYIMRGDDDAALYESELVAIFRALPEGDREAVLRTMRGMLATTRTPIPFKSTR